MDPSTHAYSVYTALSLSGRDMNADEIFAYLIGCKYDSASRGDVDVGIAFLARRGFVRVVGEVVMLIKRDPATRLAKPIKRVNEDRELEYA